MKMRYQQVSLLEVLGFPRPEPIEVEVLEVDFEKDIAKIIEPIAENTVINILRRKHGQEPLTSLERWVPRDALTMIQEASEDSGDGAARGAGEKGGIGPRS